ncbi:MAG: hypothetical protein ABJF88_19630 [Rhodothermales bacterium]
MRLLLPVLVLLFTVPVAAQVPGDLAETYLEEMGLASEIESVGAQILQQIQGQAAQMPEPARAPFRAIYAEEMNADALTARLVSYVTAEGDADRIRESLAWMDQPLVERMHAVEDSASNDANAQVAVQMYAMTGSFAAPVTPEREEQMDRYLAATDAADKGVDLYLNLIVASSESMRALTPEGKERLSADSLRAQMRPQLEGMIGGMIRGSTLYAFRDIPDAEFDAYIAQLDTPDAQYASDLGTAAMNAALVGAITEAGSRFVETLTALDAAGEISLDEMRRQGEEMRGSGG